MDENKDKVFEQLRNTARLAPETPGVYLWKDDAGTILYVGKAKSLKARLASYFSGKREVKTRHLVSRATNLEWIHTGTEYEALLLENNLIKRNSPKYNINLKDGKTYPSVRITNEEFPRVFRTRRIINDGSRYFGPYPSAEIIDQYLHLIRQLFPLRRCKTMHKRDTPCMYFHIGRCSAPCAGKTDKIAYAEQVERVAELLSGETEVLLSSLDTDMNKASQSLQFEQAAKLRDSIKAIQAFQSDSGMEDFSEGDRDYLAWESDGSLITFVVFQARGGKLVGRDLFRERCYGTAVEAVDHFMVAYFSANRLPAPSLFVKNTEGLELACEYLNRELGAQTMLELPGEKRHLAAMAMAQHNAKEDISKRRREIGDIEALEALRTALSLESLPELIEGFDIAQLSGKHTVASLVTFRNGAPDKKKYRIFKIKSLEGKIDDFGAMREASARHYTHVANGESDTPDLVLIDGGVGQVNAVQAMLDALGLEIPVVGLAKENEELWPYGSRVPIVLEKSSAALRLVVAIRDEAHRFATGMNQKLRSKTINFPILEKIPGIGPARARTIMKTFGSLEAVAEAEPEYLARVLKLPPETARAIHEAASSSQPKKTGRG